MIYPTLAHLSHFRHFSSLFTDYPSTSVENVRQISTFYAKQTQSQVRQNQLKLLYNNEIRPVGTFGYSDKQSQFKPNSTQNKANSKPIPERLKMNVSNIITINYECFHRLPGKKTKPIQTQLKSNVKSGLEFFLAFTFLCPGYNLHMQTWTIQKLLNWTTEYLTGKGIESPRLSAEMLLSQTVRLTRIELYTQFDRPVPPEQLDQLRDLVKRAGQNEPIAYLVGRTEFYSLQINVTPDCMVPRPETELLVERAIEFLRTRRSGTQFICDLCTGSGCIAVAIANNFSDARIIATDICDSALAVAAGNVKKHQLSDRINLLCGDLFDPVISGLDVNEFDLIVSNPPYVSTAESEKLDKNVKDYEPKKALFAGVHGLDVYSRIIEKAGQFLKPDGAIMLEIGYAQGPAVKELLEQAGDFSEIKIEKDFHNNDRIISAKKTSA
jgi:release factor glutamine methyltransferase